MPAYYKSIMVVPLFVGRGTVGHIVLFQWNGLGCAQTAEQQTGHAIWLGDDGSSAMETTALHVLHLSSIAHTATLQMLRHWLSTCKSIHCLDRSCDALLSLKPIQSFVPGEG